AGRGRPARALLTSNPLRTSSTIVEALSANSPSIRRRVTTSSKRLRDLRAGPVRRGEMVRMRNPSRIGPSARHRPWGVEGRGWVLGRTLAEPYSLTGARLPFRPLVRMYDFD